MLCRPKQTKFKNKLTSDTVIANSSKFSILFSLTRKKEDVNVVSFARVVLLSAQLMKVSSDIYSPCQSEKFFTTRTIAVSLGGLCSWFNVVLF